MPQTRRTESVPEAPGPRLYVVGDRTTPSPSHHDVRYTDDYRIVRVWTLDQWEALPAAMRPDNAYPAGPVWVALIPLYPA